ncbi:uncharacterized protein MELLADRAFT_70165 [Melampsora larici-populina 98AG31]|uniref:Uncharacterized protein n=1 Tax=Melampsora larici-populina (strain 98AG31 / pathotype 3-4-7) TaxID=747676 RepID=F4SDV6_MELLP|nr:uncharacterized protein MELLADRAFT_70165 [Melampsora larici-populina 98AG31]EGF97169.1 hypothetical protein MELLADRAFT_70165 [Melampsora larici-populina 98AG31]
MSNQREIGVSVPHTYTHTSRNIVICLPHERLTLTIELKDTLERLGLGKPLVPKLNPDLDTSITNHASTPLMSTSRKGSSDPVQTAPTTTTGLGGSCAAPICIDLTEDTDTDDDSTQHSQQPSTVTSTQPSSPPAFSNVSPGLFGDEVSNQFAVSFRNWAAISNDGPGPPLQLDVKPDIHRQPALPTTLLHPPAALPTNLQEWPGNDVLISSLLAWYRSAGVPPIRRARIQKWKKRYGTHYVFKQKTVYRYAAWVDLVGYERMNLFVQTWPGDGTNTKETLTVAVTRPHFQLEYNIVCGFGDKPEAIEDEDDSQPSDDNDDLPPNPI